MKDRERMRATWDAAAASGIDSVAGDPAAARGQLERLLAELEAKVGGGPCLEIGCGTGRMTAALAELWPEVVAVDVSSAMLERARAAAGERPNIRFQLVDGERLDGLADGTFVSTVCFGVVQHLPTRRVVARLLAEIARTLRPGGEALVQLPVLERGLRAYGWRVARHPAAALVARRHPLDPTATAAYRGVRLSQRELARSLARAGLHVAAHVETTDATLYSRYPHAVDVRLRLARRGG